MGVIQFIETLDRTSLTVSDEEFEKNVEAAVSAIAEKPEGDEPPPHGYVSDKSTLSPAEVTPRNSMEGERSGPRRSSSSRDGHEAPAVAVEDQAAVAGLLRTFQKPLSTIGRIFSDDVSSTRESPSASTTPHSGNTPRRSPAPRAQESRVPNAPAGQTGETVYGNANRARSQSSAEEAAARQATAEAAEAQRLQRLEHNNIVE
jgi:hypothetical protein